MGVAGRVSFFGYRSDRLSFLKQFDAFVLPSSLEGIPRCVLEAMAAQVPVIATDIPGCRDVVHDGQTGLLVPLGDARAMASAIERLAGDAVLRARLGTAGKALVESEFSAATMAARYLDLYRRVAARKAPRARLGEGRGMRILFVSEEFPYPLDTGGNVRTFHLLRALASEHEVVLLCLDRPGLAPEHVDFVRRLVHEVRLVHRPGKGPLREVEIACTQSGERSSIHPRTSPQQFVAV